jgi:hypothetical protein
MSYFSHRGNVPKIMGKIQVLQKESNYSQENCLHSKFVKSEKMEFYSTLTKFIYIKIKVINYEIYRNNEIYSKGFQNTPNFYPLLFLSVNSSFLNLRCFEKNFRIVHQNLKNNGNFLKIGQKYFIL